jgi:hypothetical protein
MSFLLQFRSQRPADACDAESPFYLEVNRIKNAKHWYKNKPLWEKALKNSSDVHVCGLLLLLRIADIFFCVLTLLTA